MRYTPQMAVKLILLTRQVRGPSWKGNAMPSDAVMPFAHHRTRPAEAFLRHGSRDQHPARQQCNLESHDCNRHGSQTRGFQVCHLRVLLGEARGDAWNHDDLRDEGSQSQRSLSDSDAEKF
ncbi:hypothetical protein LTI14_08010 [Nesterenkonia sp. YGD6]|uniref:hypothetical protein n=1 Tax=Nesterenkonia sp. YGD6 TaxID=2901231 RepID=UPI001F4CD291|nr:hypothetical protein [Nesterenkonia sp. YGD6]MCH8563155.1 hypothetical protein [Nesterenkonia sp. YGD6]